MSTIVWTHHATQYQILSLPVVPPTTTTTYHGGGSIALAMDNCKRSSNPATINLPGANDAGIDHSRSYYDRDCGVSSSTTTTTPTVDEEVTELGSIEDSPYSYDLNQAYLYGYKNKLTLADTVQKAGMKNSMTRKDLAIMVA